MVAGDHVVAVQFACESRAFTGEIMTTWCAELGNKNSVSLHWDLSVENEIIQVNPEPPDQPVVRQADSDEQLIGLWLHGRAKGTVVVYAAGYIEVLNFVTKPLHQITLGDLQAYADH